MPHSDKSTRDEQGRRVCPYCGYPLRDSRSKACAEHRDLPRLEPLDDRYTLTEDTKP